MSEGTALDVLAGQATWSLYHGDCLDLLRSLPDRSCDSLVTDPPAGISFMSGKSRNWDDPDGGKHVSDCLPRVLSDLNLPNLRPDNAALFVHFQLPIVTVNRDLLCAVMGIVNPRVCVPIRSVDFNNNAVTELEVGDAPERSVRASKGDLWHEGDAEVLEFCSNPEFNAGTSPLTPGCGKAQCCCRRHLGEGFWALPVRPVSDSCGPSFFSSFAPGGAGGLGDHVGLNDDSLDKSNRPSSVVAASGTENQAALVFDASGTPKALLVAGGAGEAFASDPLVHAEFIRAVAAARCLASVLEAYAICKIRNRANRADAIYKTIVVAIHRRASEAIQDSITPASARDIFIVRMRRIFCEAFRVLKPGAHGVVWALPRTSHWTGMALEDAGFEIRDSVHSVFGSGMPKSLNASKAIDEKDFRDWLRANPKEAEFLKLAKARVKKLQNRRETREFSKRLNKRVRASLRRRAGLEREVTGTYTVGGNAGTSTADKGGTYVVGAPNSAPVELQRTRGATEKSRQWDGYGTGLKPSHEAWWLIRKPVEKTVAENLVAHGTGAMNVDGCRIRVAAEEHEAFEALGIGSLPKEGRWPPNFLLTHDARCKRIGVATVPANPTWDTPNRDTEPSAFAGDDVSQVRHEGESVPVFECAEGCPVRTLSLQSGSRGQNGSFKNQGPRDNAVYGSDARDRGDWNAFEDSGSAARYFPNFEWDPELDAPFVYLPKPSRAETEAGLQRFRLRSGAEATSSEEGQVRLENPRTGAGRGGGVRNPHPTKKSIALTRWLARLVTPPKGAVLVPFGGSGSEGIGALLEGFRVIMAELSDTEEEPFVSIARARMLHVEGREFKPRASLAAKTPPRQQSLFGALGEP